MSYDTRRSARRAARPDSSWSLHEARDLGSKRLILERLTEPAVGADLEGALGGVGRGGEDDDRWPLAGPVELAAELPAVHDRHPHVEEDEVGPLARHRVE